VADSEALAILEVLVHLDEPGLLNAIVCSEFICLRKIPRRYQTMRYPTTGGMILLKQYRRDRR
jgi:hypothetical protein